MVKEMLFDENLEDISGGQITYTWDGTSGTLGLNGKNTYLLLDKTAFLNYYKSAQATTSEADMIRYMRENGIIKKP